MRKVHPGSKIDFGICKKFIGGLIGYTPTELFFTPAELEPDVSSTLKFRLVPGECL